MDNTEIITTASHFLRVLCEPLQKAGYDVAEVFAELGIPVAVLDDPRGLVRSEQYLSLIRKNWALLNDEFMGLSGTPCKQGHYSLMVRYIHHQDTLRAVLKEIVRYYNITRDDISVSVEILEDEVEMRFGLSDDSFDTHHFLVEFMLVVFHRTLCWLTDTKMLVNNLYWDYPEPEHSFFYKGLFDADHHFQAGRNGFSFSKKYLSLPVAVSYEELKEFLKHAPADLLVTPGTDNTFTTRIKGMVLTQQRAGLGLPDFISVARELCVSPQTLRRKLQAENTSYQNIKDGLRRDIAIDKLVNENLSVAEIGQLLGFVEPASFTRAFKQWTGISPAEYREQNYRG
ncbi:MAG: AraC family transcriptional regulator [Candidatus Pelagadaptatus aseana]